jgi:T-complex protein 1 subunit zeta
MCAVLLALSLQDTLIKLQEAGSGTRAAVGLDVATGSPLSPEAAGIWDNFRVKRQFLELATGLSAQLLLVDEVMRAGRGSRNG